jgi:hypothetical protein
MVGAALSMKNPSSRIFFRDSEIFYLGILSVMIDTIPRIRSFPP